MLPPESMVRFTVVMFKLSWCVFELFLCLSVPPFCIVRLLKFKFVFCISSMPLLPMMRLLSLMFSFPFW